ncbi:MAG: histidine kinase [Pleurocapsa sp. SU_196_0]|nr:histidine kinase [Pleurocapsa sp. SU_196_0]
MITRPQKLPRSTVFLGILLAVIVGWTVAVFVYGSFDWAVLRSGVYVAPLTFRYQLEEGLQAWREHATVIGGVIAWSFTGMGRRLLRRRDDARTQARDLIWLALFLVASYTVFFWDQHQLQHTWLIETKAKVLGDERSNYGFLFVVIAGLLGGWRVGLVAGLVNWFALGWLEHSTMTAPKYPAEPALRTILMQLWGVVGVAAGVGIGYWREADALELRPLRLLFIGTVLEIVSLLATLATTWAAPYHFDRFAHNILATGPLLALLGWWLQRQANTDPKALHLTRTELALVQAELRALRAQMNPHFLINSLSVIHHLVRTDPERARALLLDLSDVLQHTLRAGDFVTLAQEIEQTKAYLALEQARYTNRLRVQWRVPPWIDLERSILTLTLQPLVENAVRHGIAPKQGGGTVIIEILEDANHLMIRVIDDGVGFTPASIGHPPNSAHIGLANISERLRLLYGESCNLKIRSEPEHGTTVTVCFPLGDAVRTLEQSRAKPASGGAT